MITLCIVVPCYNEEEVLPKTSVCLCEKLDSLKKEKSVSEQSRIVFVDDGSTDRTWHIIEKLQHENAETFGAIKLSRNCGHQNALLAGLMHVRTLCDAAVSIDADLQDDPNVIDKFIEKFNEGCDIVYGVRNDRKTDSFFKRFTAGAFYNFMSAMGTDIVKNHADFRLMSRRALCAMAEYEEVNVFLRGIVPQLGFKTEKVFYVRKKRTAGKSKYDLRRMMSLAFDGITSFSTKPIKFVMLLGMLSFLAGFIIFVITVVRAIIDLPCTILAIIGLIWISTGMQLTAIGIIGEYVGKTYLETKARPKYIVEKILLDICDGEDI